MGHVRLGVLPGTSSWKTVTSHLDDGRTETEIVAASAKAASQDLLRAAEDPVFVEVVRLLLAIPVAARNENFGAELRRNHLNIRDAPELFDILLAVTERLDVVRQSERAKSDFGELAGRALSKTLTTMIGDALPGLFGATAADVQIAARNLSWSRSVSEYSRAFFGSLLTETLSYWLDRTLSTQVGDGLRFKDMTARSAFDVALSQYAAEATRIIKEFSGGWYGKTLHREGYFSQKNAAVFGAVALKKVVAELHRRDVPND